MGYDANAVETSAGVGVYEHAIWLAADDYIEGLEDQYTPLEQVLAQVRTFRGFRGLLNHIYTRLFKPSPNNPKHRTDQYTTMVNSVLDYNDIDLLDAIFDIYVALCAKYNQLPSVLNYCTMVGLSAATVKTWLTGAVRDYDFSESDEDFRQFSQTSRKHKQVVQRWFDVSEGAMYDNAASGNVGGIFLMKAAFGYRETAPVQVPETLVKPRLSRSEVLSLTNDNLAVEDLDLPDI